MSLSGTLGIDIQTKNGNAVSVAFSPARQIDASRLFAGKTWLEAAKLARLMFAICGNGHAVALASAAGAAVGSKAEEASLLARSILICAEALREHASRIFMDWPGLLGQGQYVDKVLQITRSCTSVQTCADFDAILLGNCKTITPVRDAAARLAYAFRDALHTQDFHVAEQLIERCHPVGANSMTEADGTVLGRHRNDARLSGIGLERRIRARLLEADLICDWLVNPQMDCPLALSTKKTDIHAGMAEVEVARGLLRHEIILDGAIVANCKISAPTSANFMPGGAAEKAVLGLDPSDKARFEWQARLAILEVDPCVAHELRFG